MTGQPAPAVSGTTLDGRSISLADFQGRNPVVLTFYAKFCAPCKEEFSHLVELDGRYRGKGLRIVGVSLDDDRQSAAVVPGAAKAGFPIVFDPKGGIAEKYGVQALPHTVVIDRDGKVNAVIIGLNLSALDRAVDEVLK